MSGFWLASYLVLWTAVVAIALFALGLAGRVSALTQGQSEPDNATSAVPSLADDGPPIGSTIPNLTLTSINGFPAEAAGGSGDDGLGQLLMFISPGCRSCQDLAEPLSALAAERGGVLPVIVMQADINVCRAFLRAFDLRAPVVCDGNGEITREFAVHRNPLGLLYGDQGVLIRKGLVVDSDDLDTLTGRCTGTEQSLNRVFPLPDSVAAVKLRPVG